MSQLEEIKARADEAEQARLNYAGESEGEGIMLAYMAEQSSYDVPKLLAALEAVDELHTRRVGKFTDLSGIPWIGDHCTECRDEWPCPTAAAIEEALS